TRGQTRENLKRIRSARNSENRRPAARRRDSQYPRFHIRHIQILQEILLLEWPEALHSTKYTRSSRRVLAVQRRRAGKHIRRSAACWPNSWPVPFPNLAMYCRFGGDRKLLQSSLPMSRPPSRKLRF